ncbi:hypothetical protein J8273_6039 [Carpediemonas membranifera]|uniref:Integrase catalytic domain-containing protein n=1 Tax=Carpediemonas membranifera TaxID=201153 RepID=A0A8J6BWL9_9EUKA|nr:hypothetical protein J8273_6039 [Carpediemonas membranifera]|eukprot:KAG9392571.1 hypothetical protein J8273_6039 [Carpediemonas membranifera]
MRRLRALLLDARDDNWPAYLPIAQHVINATRHSTTGLSPFELLFGRKSTMLRVAPDALTNATQMLEPGSVEADDIVRFQAHVTSLQQLAAIKVKAYEVNKAAGSPDSTRAWENESYVLLRYPGKPPTKLLPPLRGPLRMEGKGDHPNTYKVMDLVSKCVATVHADRLVTFHADGLTEKELEEIAATSKMNNPWRQS